MERSEETDNSVITSAVIRGTGRSLLIRICWLLGDCFLSLGNCKRTQSHVLILVSLSFHVTLVNLVLFIVISLIKGSVSLQEITSSFALSSDLISSCSDSS